MSMEQNDNNQQQPFQQQYYQQSPYQQPYETNRQGPASGKAIAALVLGILSLVVPYVGLILGIVGIVFAKKALYEIATQNLGGKGMAVAGLTTSIIGVSLYSFILFIILILGMSLGF